MSKTMQKKVFSIVLIFTMLVTAFSGCSKKSTEDSVADSKSTTAPTQAADSEDSTDSTDSEVPAETKVLRFGTHYVAELDPNYQDPTTGEYTMPEAQRQAALAALDAVKEQLNVEIEFVQYATDTRSELITSVLANNPVCDIAILWGGSEQVVLAQNILQPLDEYADLFQDEESSWMFYDKLYGHNYLLTWNQFFTPRWPLIYNATMIEKVDSLKDKDGNTIYPTDLYLEGNWTWSTFKDYLAKIQAYYANTKAPEACEKDMVQAYETDYRFACVAAIFANGGSLYDDTGIQVTSKKALDSAAYIKELMDAKIMVDPGVYDDGYVAKWTQGGTDFGLGGTVFTDCPGWSVKGASTAAAERGESIGMVPWPRADELQKDDPNYRQVLTAGDSIGILKGVDKETTKLCLEFLKLYWNTYYKTLGGVESIKEYKNASASNQATMLGLDIFNETYGDDLLTTFQELANNTVTNDYSDFVGYRVIWDEILGKSLYGIDGTPAFDVAIAANIDRFTNKDKEMQAILSSDEIKDNIAPEISVTTPFVFAAGTDPSTVKFGDYVTVKDAVDGVLDATTASYDYSTTDFNTVGKYDGGISIKMSDLSANEASKSEKVVIYDPENKEAPVLTPVEAYRNVAIDEDASTIKWAGDFIASAVDADGLDISSNITADISSLDTTTAGTYDVVITGTDFVGNTSSITLQVTVAKKEAE